MSNSLVIIPTYNEKENIVDIVTAVLAQHNDFHVLVVDDNSPDGTADLVSEMIKEDSDRIHLLSRSGKLGLGTAYIAGFRYGLQRHYDFLFEMDADFSHNPKDLVRLRAACQEPSVDIAVGSRYTSDGGVKNWSTDRHVLSRGASYYVQLFTGMKVQDPTAGFICYSRSVLAALDLDKIEFVGYAFQIEMKYAANSLGYKIAEVPIVFTDRVKGKSKMNLSIVNEAIFGVLKMVKELKKNPNKYRLQS